MLKENLFKFFINYVGKESFFLLCFISMYNSASFDRLKRLYIQEYSSNWRLLVDLFLYI